MLSNCTGIQVCSYGRSDLNDDVVMMEGYDCGLNNLFSEYIFKSIRKLNGTATLGDSKSPRKGQRTNRSSKKPAWVF